MTETATLAWGCDVSVDRIAKFSRQYPAVRFTQNYDDLLRDKSLQAIVIATPTGSHFELAKKALEAGKHVLVEKPMTGTAADAQKLVNLARKNKRLLLVDHTFAYTAAVEKIRSIVSSKTLGDLLYFDSTRINLGLIQKDCNVLWDLAVHDLTILASIADMTKVTSVTALGSAHYGKHVEDAHLHLTFSTGLAAHIHVSWLSPVKLRTTLIAGRKAMIVYDDAEPSEKIRVYDKGIEHDTTKADPFFPKYRSGDVLIPALPNTEPLGAEAKHFVACIQGEQKPMVDGEDGLAIVRILEKADESIRTGRTVNLRAK
jgi:predicted dehydrogenase